MTAIDQAFTKYLSFGGRQIAANRCREGGFVARHRVSRLDEQDGSRSDLQTPLDKLATPSSNIPSNGRRSGRQIGQFCVDTVGRASLILLSLTHRKGYRAYSGIKRRTKLGIVSADNLVFAPSTPNRVWSMPPTKAQLKIECCHLTNNTELTLR